MVMTAAEIRQSFLDFFQQHQHTIVPSSSLLPDAPNLLFTNAGMNQFVPIFLEQTPCPYRPPRVANTQKCIRAGGKHNDLEDVGLDTYHHTFFEMLGNWSFGDYFKREAIDWAWSLLVERWRLPPARLYATYFGGDAQLPADEESRQLWLRYLPADHVVAGSRKDNFWMMGDTGPCGPCSEIHIDLTPAGNAGARMVNAGSPLCMEIWNLVFIQFNANPDGSLTPLSAKHVDTGMGLERVAGIVQCTDGLRDFSRPISNYDSDLFTPILRALEQLSGRRYTGRVPAPGQPPTGEEAGDVAFRVIADHIRCLTFAVADGIEPSNEGRGYVLRRILRRAVRYGRNLGFHEPFFYKLADVVAERFGDVFPEVRRRLEPVRATLRAEEESFNRTLDRGLELFEEVLARPGAVRDGVFPADEAFKLYDTYGFPLDLTQLLARERGLVVDTAGFEQRMEEQRRRAREDYERKKITVLVVSENTQLPPTQFIGYEQLESTAVVQAVVPEAEAGQFELVLDRTPFYAEAGGQVGDTGLVLLSATGQHEAGELAVMDTQRQGRVHVHRARLSRGRAPEVGETVQVCVDAARRADVQRHHTVTHLFHWALHEVVSPEARQRGSLVAPERMRFDFNHPEKLTATQLADIERLVNERIRENARVYWFEVPYREVRGRPDVMQFFGEKYGEVVRVVQIGGKPSGLDGFSMELCGGTHVSTTGEIGEFRIVKESAVAAGIRRVEAVCGAYAAAFVAELQARQAEEAMRERERERQKEREREARADAMRRAGEVANELLRARSHPTAPIVAEVPGATPELLRAVVDALKPQLGTGVVVLGGVADGKVALVAYVTPDLVKAGQHAGKLVGEVARICGGGGGGRPDLAQAGGKQPEKLAEALNAMRRLLG
ncbi:MAG: alanine--tRNA ligase [Verrucomicrobiae bacterium]|nr:alanine--tRNA ligase [Verrucomicrobiae bacterium]